MVVPKSGGCGGGARSCGPKKTAAPKKTATTKSSSTASSRKSEEALKKRLKKVLDKTPSTSTKGNCDYDEDKIFQELLTSDVQKFILNAAKKETNKGGVKATKKATASAPFDKIDQNKPSSSGTAKKSSANCPDGSCPLVKKSTVEAKKATSTSTGTKKATSTSAGTKKATSTSVGTKKVTATSTGAKKKTTTTTAVKKKPVAAKKPAKTNSKRSTTAARKSNSCGPCGAGCDCDSSFSCGDCECCYSDESEDEDEDTTDDTSDSGSDDESDTESSYDRSYSSSCGSDSYEESVSGSTDDGGCNGGVCSRPQKPQNGKNGLSKGGKRHPSDAPWEAIHELSSSTTNSKRFKLDWTCEDLYSPINFNSSCVAPGWQCEDIENLMKPADSETEKDVESEGKADTALPERINGVLENGGRHFKLEKPSPRNRKEKSQAETKNSVSENKSEDKSQDLNNQSKKRGAVDTKNINRESSKQKEEENNEDDAPSENSTDQEDGFRKSLVPFSPSKFSGMDLELAKNIYEKIRDIWENQNEDSSTDYTYEEEEEEMIEDDDYISDEEDWYYEEPSDDGDYSGEEEVEDDSNTDSSECSEESSSTSEFDGSSSMDGDYQLPDGVEEDILIRRGEANIYDASEDIEFDSEDSSTQIFELPTENNSSEDGMDITQSSGVDSQPEICLKPTRPNIPDNESDKSSESCPQLVPIDSSSAYEYDDSDYTESSEEEGKAPPSLKPEIFTAIKNEGVEMPFLHNNNFLVDEQSKTTNHCEKLRKIFTRQTGSRNYKVITVPNRNFQDKSKKGKKSEPNQKTNLTQQAAVSTSVLSESVLSEPLGGYESEDRNETLESQALHQTATFPSVEPKFYNSINTYQVLLHLKSPIYFHGTLKVHPIAGNLNILGYNLRAGQLVEVFSPRGNSLLSLTPSKDGHAKESRADLTKRLAAFSKNFLHSSIEELVTHYDPCTDAIVLLDRNDLSKRVSMVKKYMKDDVFPGSNVNQASPYYHSEFVLRNRFFTQCHNGLCLDPAWNSVCLTDNSKLLVIGGKDVGKSTFLRYTINHNLQKFKQFLLIDLDIGQPEIFVPQTVSATVINGPILGPGYFYGLTPAKSYLYGDINVVLSPHSYLLKVKELLQYCHMENRFKNIPWIVNTMGYNKGFGAELLSIVIEHLQPTDVVQLQSSKQYNNFDFPMSSEVVRTIPRNIFIDETRQDIFDYKLFVIDSAVPSRKSERSNEWRMTPMEIRLTMMISMLGSLLSERDEWLTDVQPYRVFMDDLNIICIGDNSLSQAELLEVVNANIVYLCNNSTPGIECYGIGIVRGADKYQKTLYLLPSAAPDTLAKVNTIAVCNIPLPASILLTQGPRIKGMVPYTYNTNDDAISSKHVPKSIYRPQNFLQAARNILLNE